MKNNVMGKIVIALTDSENGGKTSTLSILASLLLDWKRYEKQQITLNSKDIEGEVYSAVIPKEEDFRLILKINNKKVGIATPGDDMSSTRENWEQLFKEEYCEIIFIAVRRKQKLACWKFIEEKAKKNGYTIIETKPFDAKPRDMMDCKQKNGSKARRLFEIAKSLIEINEQYF